MDIELHKINSIQQITSKIRYNMIKIATKNHVCKTTIGYAMELNFKIRRKMTSMKLASEIIPPFLDPYLKKRLIFDATKV